MLGQLKIVNFCQIWEIWSKLWNLLKIVKSSKNCEILLKLWCLMCSKTTKVGMVWFEFGIVNQWMNKSISKVGIVLLGQLKNISRSANAVQCHNWLSGTKDCHEFRFSIVRTVRTVITVITVSNVTNLKIVKIAKIVLKIVIKNCYQKLSKICLIKCLKSHKSPGSLCSVVKSISDWMSECEWQGHLLGCSE